MLLFELRLDSKISDTMIMEVAINAKIDTATIYFRGITVVIVSSNC